MNDILQAAARRIIARGHSNPGVTPSELDDFGQRHGVELPAEVRALYQIVNGEERSYDVDVYFWPLDHWERTTLRFPDWDLDGFVFADSMLECPVFILRTNGDGLGHEVWAALPEDLLVDLSLTFHQFLAACVSDPDSVMFPRGEEVAWPSLPQPPDR